MGKVNLKDEPTITVEPHRFGYRISGRHKGLALSAIRDSKESADIAANQIAARLLRIDRPKEVVSGYTPNSEVDDE